jgi:Tfp pilus assembly pilus retraction ATPase PilT
MAEVALLLAAVLLVAEVALPVAAVLLVAEAFFPATEVLLVAEAIDRIFAASSGFICFTGAKAPGQSTAIAEVLGQIS